MIFDGGCRDGELLAVVVRFVDVQSWSLQQRLIRLVTYSSSLDGSELTRAINDAVVIDSKIRYSDVYGFIRDSAATNGAAVTILEGLFKWAVDINCFSHTLDNVGHHVSTPEADNFLSVLISLHSLSTAARSLWRSTIGKSPRSVSSTRWWSRFEFAKDVLSVWGKMSEYVALLSASGISPALTKRLVDGSRTTDQQNLILRQLELTSRFMEPFVQATYNLEGDSFLPPFVFDELKRLSELCSDPVLKNDFTAEELAWVLPALDYFSNRMTTDCASRVAIYRLMRMFNAGRVIDINVTEADVRSLAKVFPWPEFRQLDTIEGLLSELVTYKARARELEFSSPSLCARASELWMWWGRQKDTLPTWYACVKLIALLQPSSASVERVYSLVRYHFDDRQSATNMEYLEGSVMSMYNSP